MEKCCDDKTHEEMMRKMGKNWHGHHHQNGAVYGLGFIGAAIYFIGKAATFGAGVVGLLKAIVWPAYMVFEAFKFLLK